MQADLSDVPGGMSRLEKAGRAERARALLATEELLPFGAYYYPEHWPQEQWARDIRKMADLGFHFIHMGEFAWANLEPEEGRFTFDWLDTCVAEAGRNGLRVVLCTPTPCPPAWLTEKHPEILNVNDAGMRSAHGGNRLHANQAHPAFKFYIRRMVEALGERYGRNPAVWGWQLDNEPHVSTLYDYSDFAQGHFREWLQRRYGNDIWKLNEAWGMAFWSGTYNHFGQIRIPNEKEAVNNPHAFLDFRRYTADALAETLRFQADLLRARVEPRQWITTNYAYYQYLPSVDLFRNRGDLDFSAHTFYLLSTYMSYPEGPLAFRLGSGMELAISMELARSVDGVTGIMELQPGQINWGQYNAQPLPGAVRMWIWHAFGLGDEFVCTYRFRQPRFGSEQTHKGILETDGVTVARGGQEFVSAIAEINGLQARARPEEAPPAAVAGRRTAFLWKQDNLWEMQASPHTKSWNTWQHWYAYYGALKQMGAPVEFVQEGDELDPRETPFLVVTAGSMVDEAVVQHWRRYAEAGGHLILSCRTGQKDNMGHFPETLLQARIWDLIGAEVRDNDQLPPGRTGVLQAGESTHVWNVWGELLAPRPGTRALAVYADQYYAGTPAAVTRPLGKGSVTYVGVWSEKGTLERQVLREVYARAGARILDLPPYAFVEWREGFYVGVNYTSAPVSLPVPAEAEVLVGAPVIGPGEVCVWQEKAAAPSGSAP